MTRDLLTVEALRTGFGANVVLHGVGFSVREGEIAAILGLNGAGKSVTLKVVAGIVPAWSGSVTFDGTDVTRRQPEDRVARGMGHVTQSRGVFPDLTVEENLRVGAYLLRRRDRARYADNLERLYTRFPRLAERRTQLAGTLSGGERAMLALARALIAEPKLLLVDEPTAGLAPVIVEEFADALRAVRTDGVTILLVEQNIRFALRVADTVHIMQHGHIVHIASPSELQQDALVRYLGIGRLLAPVTARADASPPNGGARASRKGAAKKPAKKTTKKPAKKPATARTAKGKKTAAKGAVTKKTTRPRRTPTEPRAANGSKRGKPR